MDENLRQSIIAKHAAEVEAELEELEGIDNGELGEKIRAAEADVISEHRQQKRQAANAELEAKYIAELEQVRGKPHLVRQIREKYERMGLDFSILTYRG